MDTDLNQSNSENPANTRINHARHGSEKHSLQPNTSSNSIDTIEDDGNISKNIQLPFSGEYLKYQHYQYLFFFNPKCINLQLILFRPSCAFFY